MAKKTTINKTLRFDKEQIEKAEKLAAEEMRSFNNWLASLIDKEIKQKEKEKPKKTQ